MAGAAARWLLPLRAGRRCVSRAVTSAAPRPQKSTPQGHDRRRLPTHCTISLSSDTGTPRSRATARRNSSVALSTYGTYTHSAARVPARTVTQPSPQNLLHRTFCPFSSALCASSLASVPVTYTARGLWCFLFLCPDVLLPRALGESVAVFSWTALGCCRDARIGQPVEGAGTLEVWGGWLRQKMSTSLMAQAFLDYLSVYVAGYLFVHSAIWL